MHHDYVGLGKRESKTSTKWSARNPPPSLGSRDRQPLTSFPSCFHVLEFSGMEREVASLMILKICCQFILHFCRLYAAHLLLTVLDTLP